ncbi:MAG: PAS domain S-box protein [Bacteroidetes bacterium]|nr:PAS domain S-box protein [Bacteroidota bacterium]
MNFTEDTFESENSKNKSKLREEIDLLKEELIIQKEVSFKAGILQGDITIKTLLESLSEAVVIIDSDSRIILINKIAENIFGYKQDELVGKQLSLLIPSKYHTAHASHVDKYYSEPRIRQMGKGIDLTGVRKNGTEFQVEIGLSSLVTDAGRLGLAFVSDITKRKELENQLKKQNEELDSFAHTVAHDLKDTLVGVVGFSELLTDERHTFTEEERKSYLKEIASSSRKLSNIVSELLLLVTIVKRDVVTSEIEMNPLINEVVKRLNYLIVKSDAKIKIAEKLHCSFGYPAWIEEIWFNFLSNAIKYGGSPPKIEIGSEIEENGFVKYWIKDNGDGIDPKHLNKIFESPEELDQSIIRGHGLGLSIVRQILEKLSGYAKVESELGKGSEFSFFLPQKRAITNLEDKKS